MSSSTVGLSADNERLKKVLPDTWVVRDVNASKSSTTLSTSTSTTTTSNATVEIGGCRVDELVARFGTPLYVYCEATMRNVCREYVTAFRDAYAESHVEFSSKALPHAHVARLVASEGLCVDVVSGGELAVALAGGVAPERLNFHGNNKTRVELSEALACGIGRITVDSFRELDLLDELAAVRGARQRVLLRLSPSVDAHTHLLTTTGVLDSKFGFSIETGAAADAVAHALRRCPHLELVGVHLHLGSPLFELEPYVQAIEYTLAFVALMCAAHSDFTFREFSPGGG